MGALFGSVASSSAGTVAELLTSIDMVVLPGYAADGTYLKHQRDLSEWPCWGDRLSQTLLKSRNSLTHTFSVPALSRSSLFDTQSASASPRTTCWAGMPWATLTSLR